MAPSTTVSELAGTAARRAAASMNSRRAAAPTARTAAPLTWVDRLPAVNPSSGDAAVDSGATSSWSGDSPSSVTAIWARAVWMP